MNIFGDDKIYEVLDKGNSKFKLTITPTRITIKLAEGSSKEEQKRVITFCQKVANQPAMKNCTQSYRGTVSYYAFKDIYQVQMNTDNKKNSNVIQYNEDEI